MAFTYLYNDRILDILTGCHSGDKVALLDFSNLNWQIVQPMLKFDSTFVSNLTRMSEESNTYALYFLGLIYKYGCGVAQNKKIADEIFMKVYAAGNYIGLIAMAYNIEENENNILHAVNLYIIAANNNNTFALWKLYWLLDKKQIFIDDQDKWTTQGQFTRTKSNNKRIECLTKAADLGHINSILALADHYNRAFIVPQNHLISAKYYLKYNDVIKFTNALKLFITSAAPIEEKISAILDPSFASFVTSDPILKNYKETQVYFQIRELYYVLTDIWHLPVEIVKSICEWAATVK